MLNLIESTKVCNFTDDTTFFACDKDLKSLIKRLKNDSLLAIEWFQKNHMKLNQGKHYLLVSGYKHENVWAQIGDEIIWESNKQKLPGLQIAKNLILICVFIMQKIWQKTFSRCRIIKFHEH